MENVMKKKVSFLISGVILQETGRFTEKDIIEKTKDQIQGTFQDEERMKKYVVKKLNTMSEYGLVGRTSVYYFSL